jgi:glycogen debranching enzyme
MKHVLDKYQIFDADAPHHPRGCVAQAWGVAEILRVIKDYSIIESKKPKEKNQKLTRVS